MRIGALLLSVLFLFGCAQQPFQPAPDRLFADALFKPPSEPANAGEIFALSPAMRDYLDGEIAEQIRAHGPRRGLFEALRGGLRLEYDATMTRNAAQAFEARAGNCLSLVIMTAAFARQLGIPVHYQSVFGQDTWSRGEELMVLSGHINIGLGASGRDRQRDGEQSVMTVDFLPPEELRGQYRQEVPEATVLAMYMNNRAAESLAQGQIDQAYWWARAAIGTAPDYQSAYNTLGVIYVKHGEPAQAERALHHALERMPGDAEALSNLVGLLEEQGRVAEAAAHRAKLARLDAEPPYHYFDLGLAALQRKDYREARRLFRKELARMPYAHEIHFALAMTHLRLGESRLASQELRLALDSSTTPGSRDLYAAKLDHLRELQLN
ncbi:MAG: tetratricopeptide repeat protein [Nevskiaceae bacterium]|jgi:Tfp pilus assembly protein PilF|nr:MAG: tetratricopeptide repeat protein [Nevskiaceae bacterium]TAM28620.1 MAG: tetratricopeptide repeat protein [Nevskiaceae bacterium]